MKKQTELANSVHIAHVAHIVHIVHDMHAHLSHERTQKFCSSLRQPVGRNFTNLNRLILAVTEDL